MSIFIVFFVSYTLLLSLLLLMVLLKCFFSVCYLIKVTVIFLVWSAFFILHLDVLLLLRVRSFVSLFWLWFRYFLFYTLFLLYSSVYFSSIGFSVTFFYVCLICKLCFSDYCYSFCCCYFVRLFAFYIFRCYGIIFL
jgi:hypothetical protein